MVVATGALHLGAHEYLCDIGRALDRFEVRLIPNVSRDDGLAISLADLRFTVARQRRVNQLRHHQIKRFVVDKALVNPVAMIAPRADAARDAYVRTANCLLPKG